MALPEGLEVKASYLTMILAEEGSPPKKLKKKFVLKCFLVNFKGSMLMFFFNNKKNNGKLGQCQPHPPTSRVYKVAGTLIFLPTHLRVLIFSTKSHISLTRKCLDIAKIEIYIAFLGFYETMDGKYVHFLKILISHLLRFHRFVCL